MAEYAIAFGERLAERARMVAGEGLVELDAQRTVLYLSLLSAEINPSPRCRRACRGWHPGLMKIRSEFVN
jgi:hypothetical protein